jgi:hypothetical protein
MSAGARWMWDVLDKTVRIFAVIALLAVSVGSGVLLRKPAAVIGGVVGLLVLIAFAEGTYRVARDAGEQRAAAKPDNTAVWLSARLAQGNLLLANWPPYASGAGAEKAAKWEREIQAGLIARLPKYFGHFSTEVGLGLEFTRADFETEERARLRRRLYRLGEISDRYSREQAT